MKRLILLLLALSSVAMAAYAHNGMEHVMGTVTQIADGKITVKNTAGKYQAVLLTATTKYLNGAATSSFKEIKVGDHIVIHASKKGTDLVAVDVKIGSMKVSTWANHMGGSMDSKPVTTTPH